MVARPTGREQRPRRVTPPAYAAAVIGYTTSRDAIKTVWAAVFRSR